MPTHSRPGQSNPSLGPAQHPGRPDMRITHALLLIPVLASPLAAQSDKIALADYLEWETVSNPQLSPDGKQIVFARRWVDKLNDRWESSLYIMNIDGSR